MGALAARQGRVLLLCRSDGEPSGRVGCGVVCGGVPHYPPPRCAPSSYEVGPGSAGPDYEFDQLVKATRIEAGPGVLFDQMVKQWRRCPWARRLGASRSAGAARVGECGEPWPQGHGGNHLGGRAGHKNGDRLTVFRKVEILSPRVASAILYVALYTLVSEDHDF